MSEIIPKHKAKIMVDKILSMCQEENITIEEMEDIPAELQRRINRNIKSLKQSTKFTFHM